MLQKLFTYAILLVYANSAAQNPIDVKTFKSRLPRTTTPLEYWLRMVPDVEDGKFRGEVTVKIEINSATKTIVLHAEELNVTSVNVSNVFKVMESSYKLSNDSDFPVIVIDTIELLQPKNVYNVSVKFAGIFQQEPSELKGYYRITHEADQQASSGKFAAVTQFEPIDARRAFPCYDEPAFKTPFTISIARRPRETVRSNMPVDYESKPDDAINNRTWVTFQKTLPMSTYLVAFVTFEYSNVQSDDEKLFVWSRRAAIEETVFPLRWGEQLLHHMENYLNITYALPKLDMVAIRGSSGAMENWGLITFREASLLCDDQACSQKYQVSVIETIAHEIAHQWFGNLVTMDWWGSLWLKEGFATYFKYFLVQNVIRTWPADEFFVANALHEALKYDYDVERKTRPMTNNVVQPEEIRDIYDSISYDKGASILRMISHAIGPLTFQSALQRFVRNGYKAGGVVTTSNLWMALEEQLKQDQVELNLPSTISPTEFTCALHRWTTTAGYPIIKVTSKVTKTNRMDVIIEQDTSNLTLCELLIPLTKAKKSKPDFQTTAPFTWLAPGKFVPLRNELANDEWIIINVQQTGYYRVNYEVRLWNLLIDQLKQSPEKIHVLNRAQLLDDSYALAQRHALDIEIPLSLMEYLANEQEILPWLVAIDNFEAMLFELSGETLTRFTNFFSDCLRRQYQRIGFATRKTDDKLTKIGRSKILEIACRFNIDDCVQRAKDEYEKNRANLNGIDPELKFVVFCTMLRLDVNKTKASNELQTLYKNMSLRCDKDLIFEAQSSCLQPREDIKRFFDSLISDEGDDYFANNHKRWLKKLFKNPEAVVAGLEVINEQLSTARRNTTDEKKQRNLVNLVHSLRNSGVRLGEHLQTITKLEHDVRSFDDKRPPNLVHALRQLKLYAAESHQHRKIDETRIIEFFRKVRQMK